MVRGGAGTGVRENDSFAGLAMTRGLGGMASPTRAGLMIEN